ncbi:MAG: ABC-2 transporter permease [Limnochordales bacterium]|nr:ABC-2 transporter permease [Limnochordales bacterium]
MTMALLQNVLAIACKDIKQMRKLLLFLNGLLLVYSMLLAFLDELDGDLVPVAMMLVIGVAGFATRSAMAEEQHWRFLYSLPLTKSHIALGKYVALLAAASLYLLSAAGGLVLRTLFQRYVAGSSNGLVDSPVASLWQLAIFTGVSLLFAGALLAVAFRWGIRTAMNLQFVPLVFVFFGAIPGFKELAHKVRDTVLMTWQAVNPGPGATAVIFILAILAIYWLQAFISARLLESREV